jgi:hypothetical protein
LGAWAHLPVPRRPAGRRQRPPAHNTAPRGPQWTALVRALTNVTDGAAVSPRIPQQTTVQHLSGPQPARCAVRLFPLVWLAHDLEEVVTAERWSRIATDLVPLRAPWVPDRVIRSLGMTTGQMAVAAAVVGVAVAASPLPRSAATARISRSHRTAGLRRPRLHAHGPVGVVAQLHAWGRDQSRPRPALQRLGVASAATSRPHHQDAGAPTAATGGHQCRRRRSRRAGLRTACSFRSCRTAGAPSDPGDRRMSRSCRRASGRGVPEPERPWARFSRTPTLRPRGRASDHERPQTIVYRQDRNCQCKQVRADAPEAPRSCHSGFSRWGPEQVAAWAR